MAEELSTIHEHALFFDEILESIPASMYLAPTEEETQHWKNGFKKNNIDQRKRELKEKAQKRRKERFDPENDKSMTEKIIERKKQLEKEVDEAVRLSVPVPQTKRAKSLDELRDRLREKIEVLQKNRIGEEATKKKRTSQKRENSKKEAAPDKRPKVEEAKSTPISDTDTESVLSLTPSVDDVITNIQFGKLKGTEEVDTSLRPTARKDIHKLLRQAQKKQEYLKKLKESDEGKKEAENLEWSSAMSRAEGVRKKDNPALLKKTIKRQEAKKKKSQEEWAHRKQAEKKKNRPGFEGKKREFLNGKKGGKNEKKE